MGELRAAKKPTSDGFLDASSNGLPGGGSPGGAIEVSPRAIARIAERSALESYGVVGLARRFLPTLRGWLSGRGFGRGIEVRFDERAIVIDLYVVVEYGTRVSEVASNVVQNVRFAVERAVGLPLVQVNVHVQQVRVSEA